MVSAINTALSGLAAASKRVQVAANNIANQFSTKSLIDGESADTPYVPQKVDQVSLTTGGVLAQVNDANPATQQVPDINNPGQLIDMPNVDLAQELINLKISSYDFKANLRTIETQNEMDEALLDIKT
jgi:flagellar basal-body rod protein FlgC